MIPIFIIDKMKTYYIVYETSKSVDWIILETENDLDTEEGLMKELDHLQSVKADDAVIINWKELDRKSFLQKIFRKYK